MNDNYHAYLLRLKRSPGRSELRATVKNVHTGTVRHFASKKELLLFLLDRMDGDWNSPETDLGSDIGPLNR